MNSGEGGNRVAVLAIESIIGRDGIVDAVECCIEGRSGFAVAQSVLKFVRSPVAMEYCYAIIRSKETENRRKFATILLRDIADDRVLEWMPGIIGDKNDEVQFWGFLIYEALYDLKYMDIADLQDRIQEGSQHPSFGVNRAAQHLRTRFTHSNSDETK